MKTCFGYVRVSTQKQGEGVSLEAQRDAIEQFAVRNDIRISQWFEEKVTAAKKGRPLFNKMIGLLRSGKAQGVVMHKIDRSARNFADWARIGDLSDAGVDVHFASETLDFRSRGGRLSADIQAVIAADYIRNLRDETHKGMRGRLKQGLFPWGAPLGYINNGRGKPKSPDPLRAPLVRQLFQLYAGGGHSILSLRQEMERRGLRSSRGGVVSKGGIERILSNPFYSGRILVRTTGETFVGAHEPLIAPSVFQEVQDRKAGRAGKKVTRHNHLFSGLFRCGKCGVAMTPERQKGHVYYRCHTLACPTTCIREEVIADLVRQKLLSIRLTAEQHTRIREVVTSWFEAADEDQQLRAIELQLDQVEVRRLRVTDLLIDGTISREDYIAKGAELVEERLRLAERRAQLQRGATSAQDLQRFLELIENLALHYCSATRATKRQIVELATSNRYVGDKNPGLEPQEWLMAPQFLVAALGGDPNRDTSRTGRDMPNRHVEALIEAARSEQMAKMWALLNPPEDDDELLLAA